MQVKNLQQEIDRLSAEASNQQNGATRLLPGTGDNTEKETLVDETRQLEGKLAKQMDEHNRLLQDDQQVRELHRQVDDMRDPPGPSKMTPMCDQEQVAAQETQRQRLELAEKEAQLGDLQQQLSDELSERANLQGQVVEKDRQLREMQLVVEDSDLLRQQAVQDWLRQKTNEVCDLQDRLTQEMTLRQDVQYQVIEKERVICDLQMQLARSQTIHDPINKGSAKSKTGPSMPARVGVAATFHYKGEWGEGSSSPRNTEGGDSTCEELRESSQQLAGKPLSGFGPPVPLGTQPPMVPTVRPSRRARTFQVSPPNHVDTKGFTSVSIPRAITMPSSHTPRQGFRESVVTPTAFSSSRLSIPRAVTMPCSPSSHLDVHVTLAGLACTDSYR